MATRPRILLVPAGGTISTAQGPDGYGVDSGQGAEVLAEALFELAPAMRNTSDVRVRATSLATADTLSMEGLLELGQAIAGARGIDGCVVTHGTDMIEETAYYLALVTRPRFPIVLTGSMRPPYVPGSDAAANLLGAMAVAVAPTVAQYGPVVVFNDEIHAARWVTKVNASLLGAFASPEAGSLGCIVEGNVILNWQRRTGSDYLGLPVSSRHRVEIVWTYAGVDGAMVDAALAVADGLVVAGTGGGHVSPAMGQALAQAAQKGVPVVLASRTLSGPTLEATYAGPGSEVDLLASGLLPSGGLSAVKARLRLLVALELGLDPAGAFPRRN
jgi:L-asparaginase